MATINAIQFFGGLFLHKKALENTNIKKKTIYTRMLDIDESLNNALDIDESLNNALDLRGNKTAPITIDTSESIKIPITLIKKTSGEVKVRFSNKVEELNSGSVIDLR